MVNCPKCGAQVSNDAKFCGECGEKLEQNNAVPSADDLTSQSSQNGYIEDKTIQDMFLKTTGRLNRLRYFKRCLAIMSIAFVAIIFGAVSLNQYDFNTFMKIISILFMPFNYCLNVRRLQDMNCDNKLAIASLVIQGIQISEIDTIAYTYSLISSVAVVISMIIGMFLLFKDGTHGVNDYGPDPLNR